MNPGSNYPKTGFPGDSRPKITPEDSVRWENASGKFLLNSWRKSCPKGSKKILKSFGENWN